MKVNYSRYFWMMMFFASICTLLGTLLIEWYYPTLSAVSFVVAFILWYAGIMAPADEKYKENPD
jgi:hypothetical protein